MLNQKVPIEVFHPDFLESINISVDVLRLDLLHPVISGNKWYKLKHNLLEAKSRDIKTILSFGGAWSNHIHALAAAGKHFDFKTIGVIRGEKPKKPSATLQDVESWGMELVYVSRSDYRRRYEPEYHQILLDQLSLQPNDVWVVPEGGSGELGVKGCEEILASGEIDPIEYDQIWLAAGTGATAAGVIRSVAGQCHVKVVSVLKGAAFMEADIKQYLDDSLSDCSLNDWSLKLDNHCGGYGKTTPELMQFIVDMESQCGLSLDQVYTGKVFLAFKKEIEAGSVTDGSRVLLIHTGGLQGRRGIAS